MNKADTLYVAGHTGLAGSAIVRRLQAEGYRHLLTRTHAELDLTEQASVRAFFGQYKPDVVFLAAAKVGGILANSTYPADFIRVNLQIETNVIDAAWRAGVKKLCVLGSSCIYPKLAPQPMREEHLLTGLLEPTNQWYAIAKIAGILMAQAYRRQYGFHAISLMPTNLYGPEDNFDLNGSHVLPGLMRRFHEAKAARAPQVVVWGTGAPRREFLHADDLADAALFLMERYDAEEIINVGTGEDLTIRDVAELMRAVVGYGGEIVFDPSKPDGMARKLLDISRLRALGWSPKIALRQGLQDTYRWYVQHENGRGSS